MSFRRFSAVMAGAVCAIQLITANPASAQELSELIDKSITLMQQNKWEEALAVNEQIDKDHGEGAADTFGPRFGGVYYRKGICELKLKKWDAAMTSFEKCYKDFANKPGGDPASGNPFAKSCLLQWAEAAMGKEEWQQALDLYAKFMAERDKEKDRYTPGPYYTSLAICYYNLADFTKGNENLEIVIQNQEKFRVSDAMLVNVFRYFAEAALKENKEQVLLDFIKKNRGAITVDPFDMYPFAPQFIKMANEALNNGLPRAATELYALVPGTELALSDARSKLLDLGPLPRMRINASETLIKKQLEDGIEQLEKATKADQNVEMIKLAAAAFLHEQNRNAHGAFASYRLLEEFYPNAKNREDNLFNLARIAFAVDTCRDGLIYAQRFLEVYPQSPKVEQIRRLMLATLFSQQKYEECIEIATKQLPILTKGTQQHDICLYVLGGSYFYKGEYEKATPHLDEHVKTYEKSDNAMPVRYFQASNAYRLGDHKKAGELLDAFIKAFPDGNSNVFLPAAYLDRANCHYFLDENDPALAKVDELIKLFPEAQVMDQAYILRGNIMVTNKNMVEAEGAYQQGLRMAERNGNPYTCSEAIYHILGMMLNEAGENKPFTQERLDQAIGYIDKFWKEFASEVPPYAREMSVLQLPILTQAQRLDEAIERLRKTIIEMAAEDPNSPRIEAKLDAYTEGFLKKYPDNGAEEIKKHYLAFDGIPKAPDGVNALLLVQVIKVYGDLLKKAEKQKDEKVITATSSTIKVLFEQLKKDFDVKKLPGSVLVKVADYLRQKTATPREALPFYNELLERKDKQYEFAALLGRADIFGESGAGPDIDQALGDFQKIYEGTPNKNEKEFSLNRMIQLLVAKRDYEQAIKRCQEFLDKDSGFQKSKNAPMVGLLMGKAFEGLKKNEDALAMYARVWSTHKGNIRASAPAMKRYMELLWERNQPAPVPTPPDTYSDRQSAYIVGAQYIEQTTQIKDRMNEGDLELWGEVESLVKQYAANPNIKNLEQLKREKAEKR